MLGWGGRVLNNPPPSREDVLKEIEALDPNLKAVIEVGSSGIAQAFKLSKKTYDSRLNNNEVL